MLGLTVGDAFGETFFCADFADRLANRRLPEPPWKHTDDTIMATVLLEHVERFGRVDQNILAREWGQAYLDDPNRGYGSMAHIVLNEIGNGAAWQNISRSAFGGQGSYGNGAAMRVAPLGAFFADDLAVAIDEARAQAVITHSHPEAVEGAIAVAAAAAWACQPAGTDMWTFLLPHLSDGPVRTGIKEASGLPLETSPLQAAATLGNGSAVRASDTVPFALWCVARHTNNFREALWTAVSGHGDLDTLAAIVGGIVGLADPEGVPPDWCRTV